jgi:hypothetical protein
VRRACLACLAAALVAAPLAARAESPRFGSFELGAGSYRPSIDAGYLPPSTGTDPGPPYARVFGNGRGWLFRAGAAWALLTRPGALELGFRTGFFRASGSALQITNDVISTTPSADRTTFNVVPTSLTLTYRLDWFADRVGIPFAPYGRVALERYNWWITGGSGGISNKGGTNGYSFTGGIAFMLDFLDPGLAREMDEDTGINHTYLFLDVTKSKVNDFGSKTSWDLSDPKLAYGFGVMFVF